MNRYHINNKYKCVFNYIYNYIHIYIYISYCCMSYCYIVPILSVASAKHDSCSRHYRSGRSYTIFVCEYVKSASCRKLNSSTNFVLCICKIAVSLATSFGKPTSQKVSVLSPVYLRLYSHVYSAHNYDTGYNYLVGYTYRSILVNPTSIPQQSSYLC